MNAFSAPPSAMTMAQKIADSCGERVWLSLGPNGWRVVKNSEMSPITIHCAQIEIKAKEGK